MKLILIIFLSLIFDVSNGQLFLPQYGTKLVTDGKTYLPATGPNARTQQFESYRVGVMIGFNLNTLVGDSSSYTGYPNYAPNHFNDMFFNIKNWISTLKANQPKLDYCVLTMFTAHGFALEDLDAQWPDTAAVYTTVDWPSGYLTPKWKKYDVGATNQGNKNFFGQFVKQCRLNGIEPIPYISFADARNWVGGNLFNTSSNAQIAFTTWISTVMQELIIKYKVRYIWVDDYGNFPSTFMQKIYNAIKVVSNSDCMLIADCQPGQESTTWPFDIHSIEEYQFSHGATISSLNPRLTISGTSYYIPTEVVATCWANEEYYYYAGGAPHPLAGMNFTMRTQTSVNGIYDTAKANYSRCLLNITPDSWGIISPPLNSLIQNLQ